MKKITLLFISMAVWFSSYATHIIGGELTYEYIGNDIYAITLKVFRDCLNGQSPFDVPAYIAVYDVNNNLLLTSAPEPLQIDSIPVSLGCSSIPINICAEQGIYKDSLTLPPLAGGYTLTYQRCCRSGIIENLADPLNEGMTIMTTIPDPSIALENSSPTFDNYPPTAFCVGIPIYFNHQATDADGDSIAYSFSDGIAGASSFNPHPIPPFPPPYYHVTYVPPYSGAYPFNTDPALTINPTTGIITGTPSSIGVFTLCVLAKEYRNGVLIGEHRREMAEVYTYPGLPTTVTEINENADVIIYPVPATHELRIVTVSSDWIKEARIFDLTGRLLITQKIKPYAEIVSLSLDGFMNGEYQLQLIREASVQTQAFVIMK